MSEWWETAYPGGPMVAVKGFPRSCYPPDAAPTYTPSANGSDIEGYKRTVSRAGRWKWQAFDQAFSNSFSHGKAGGAVAESGIAGIQRQQKIQPTGFIGRDTFNLLRSIRIPQGLPHAGEAAMDATAVRLINQAYDRFKGEEKPEPSGGSAAQARLTAAVAQVGNKENPPNSNRTKYGQWYGMDGVPWCAIFTTWADQTDPKPYSDSLTKGTYYAYVPYIVSDARAGRRGLSVTSNPKPGDLVCYDWGRDGEYDHVGIFESGDANKWTAIEGNTSTSDNSNGGQVMRRTRQRSDANIVFVRIAE